MMGARELEGMENKAKRSVAEGSLELCLCQAMNELIAGRMEDVKIQKSLQCTWKTGPRNFITKKFSVEVRWYSVLC